MDIDAFRQYLIKSVYRLLRGSRVKNNYDFRRFKPSNKDVPNPVNYDERARYFSYVMAHIGMLHSTYLLLADNVSREMFLRLLLFRSVGYEKFPIDPNKTWETEQKLQNDVKRYDEGMSVLGLSGMFGEIRHHERIPTDNGEISLDCWPGNIASTVLKRQYFLERGSIFIRPEEGDWVIDAGACFGDTAVFFAKSVGDAGRVLSFDPVQSHGIAVLHNIKQNSLDSIIEFIPAAVGASSNGKVLLPPSERNNLADPGFTLRHGSNEIPIISIDDAIMSRKNGRVNFIKMDVEGFELEALRGAEASISAWKPKLAISLYHKKEDYIEIPQWITSRFPEYRFYIEHYSIHGEETVLYAIAQR